MLDPRHITVAAVLVTVVAHAVAHPCFAWRCRLGLGCTVHQLRRGWGQHAGCTGTDTGAGTSSSTSAGEVAVRVELGCQVVPVVAVTVVPVTKPAPRVSLRHGEAYGRLDCRLLFLLLEAMQSPLESSLGVEPVPGAAVEPLDLAGGVLGPRRLFVGREDPMG